MPRASIPTHHRALYLIPLAGFLALLPMILHGGSCGHDMAFHIQGWYDAAAQLRHFHYPRWSFTSAWNAGEPRFLFYPPLSWLLGSVLTFIFPPQAAIYAFIWLSLTIAGLAMYRLAVHFTTPSAALIAAALYLANPYMLFNAFERSAFAELLAAAWIPLLLLAVLRTRPTIPAIAVPLALLWLTNAPAAVMASYTLALLATLRIIHAFTIRIRQRTTPPPSLSSILYPLSPASLAFTFIAGTALGLTLPAFFLIPAAYERRYIQIAMAVIPNMRIQDNFFFRHTADPGHNGVNLQISLLSLTLLALTIAAVAALVTMRVPRVRPLGPGRATIPTHPHRSITALLAILTAALTFMLFPISTFLWNHLPEMSFLQFPWRLTALVSAVLCLTLALLLHRPHNPGAPGPDVRTRARTISTLAATLLLPLTLGLLSFHLYAQFCQPKDHPAAIADLLHTHHGYPPTDEYTPNDADSDVLRTSNPGYWLTTSPNPNTPAPNTIPTPAELDPTLLTDDTPIPITQTVSQQAPTRLTLNLPQQETLILHLRNYPDWQVTRTTPTNSTPQPLPTPPVRDDGLIEVPIPAGPSTIDIHWRMPPDQQLGLALSTLALLTLLFLLLPFWLSFRSAAKEPAS